MARFFFYSLNAFQTIFHRTIKGKQNDCLYTKTWRGVGLKCWSRPAEAQEGSLLGKCCPEEQFVQQASELLAANLTFPFGQCF